MGYFLNTTRLALRPLAQSDLHNLIALDSDPEVMRFLTGGKSNAPDDVARNLTAMCAPRGGLQTWAWAAEDGGGGEFLGWLSLRPDLQRSPVNQASRRVMDKAGLIFVRTFFAEWPEVIAGAEHGDVEYAVSRADWERRRPQAVL